MDIEVERAVTAEVISLRLNGIDFDSDDGGGAGGGTWVVPKSCLRRVSTASLPEDVQIECCESVQENIIHVNTIPFSLRRLSPDTPCVEFEEMQRRKEVLSKGV